VIDPAREPLQNDTLRATQWKAKRRSVAGEHRRTPNGSSGSKLPVDQDQRLLCRIQGNPAEPNWLPAMAKSRESRLVVIGGTDVCAGRGGPLTIAFATAGHRELVIAWATKQPPGPSGQRRRPGTCGAQGSPLACRGMGLPVQRMKCRGVIPPRWARVSILTAALVLTTCASAGAVGASVAKFRTCYPNPGGPNVFPHNVAVHNISCVGAGGAINAGRATNHGDGYAIRGYRCTFVRGTSFESREYSCTRGSIAFHFQLGG
jgi:hypothetical protein